MHHYEKSKVWRSKSESARYFRITVPSLNSSTIRPSDWHNFHSEFFSWIEHHRALPKCVPISVSPVAYCCTLKATRFARWMHLWPPIDGMKSGRRQGASMAPLPVPIPWSCFGKRGARESPLIARELHWILDRDCLVSWKNPLLLHSRYWLYRNRRIDLVRAFSPVTKINTPHWIRK